jgi:hypothetical protein
MPQPLVSPRMRSRTILLDITKTQSEPTASYNYKHITRLTGGGAKNYSTEQKIPYGQKIHQNRDNSGEIHKASALGARSPVSNDW